MVPSRVWLSFVSGCALLLIGCVDQDPFGLSRKRVKTSYSLEQFEGGVGRTNKEIFIKRFSTSLNDSLRHEPTPTAGW